MAALAVIDVLRRFLPAYLKSTAVLSKPQRRAIWALCHCRSPAMGGHLYACTHCQQQRFVYHSCNHRACPQCGKAATAQWVQRELDKRTGAACFMVTFTLPAELREIFFGPRAKDAYDLFFAATARILRDKLADPKWLGAQKSGFTGVLHTWNQKLGFHPHLHYVVNGAGLDAAGRPVQVNNANFLLPLPVLRTAFAHAMREELKKRDWQVDPGVWAKKWGVHIQPFGSGQRAIQYLGTYVNRTAISDNRLISIDNDHVTFHYQDRAAGGRIQSCTLRGEEFVSRYLRHVLPRGLRSIRHFGYCHPAAKHTRQRVAFHTGRTLFIGPQTTKTADRTAATPRCPCCQRPMTRGLRMPPQPRQPPPIRPPPHARRASFNRIEP